MDMGRSIAGHSILLWRSLVQLPCSFAVKARKAVSTRWVVVVQQLRRGGYRGAREGIAIAVAVQMEIQTANGLRRFM